MRTKFALAALAVSLLFMSFQNEPAKSTATVDQKEGVYIFMLSKPAAGYDYLGTVQKVIAISGKPDEMLTSMIRKAKKEYPSADGIIFTSVNMDVADVVKFK
jgi:hypothetical protein